MPALSPTDVIAVANSTANIVIANTLGLVTSALPNSGVSAGTYTGNSSQVISISVDAKGLVTAASNVAVKMTGRDWLLAGNTITDYTVTVSTSGPSGGNEGDVWYQVAT